MRLKSQVTMLLIVGMVIFIAISLVLYLSKLSVKKQAQQNIKKTHDFGAEIQPIKDFVGKCLDKLSKDSIVLLGKQGGYIYRKQGGALVDYQETDQGIFFIRYGNADVAYNILPPKFALQPYSAAAPEYPWETFPYRSATSNPEIFEGFFGISNMPPLNASDGPNSIQAQMEYFIDNNLKSCTNFESFENQGLEIAAQPPKTEVMIGSGHVGVRTKMQLKITSSQAETAEISEFSTDLDIRLRDLYFFARSLIEDDIKNVKFNISSGENSKDFFDVAIERDVFSKDDIIIVRDSKSLVYGKPLEYIFARRNRMPALYYIRKTALQFEHMHVINQSDLLERPLKAEDPDEDTYIFTITPKLPKTLDVPQLKFRIEASDGRLSDYQIITVSRI